MFKELEEFKRVSSQIDARITELANEIVKKRVIIIKH